LTTRFGDFSDAGEVEVDDADLVSPYGVNSWISIVNGQYTLERSGCGQLSRVDDLSLQALPSDPRCLKA
jgi:hypothetical protein